jgi:formate-dependent nitrite reductase membrane component NrfD
MNRAFLIVGIPAVLASCAWLAVGWGWRVAVAATCAEIAAMAAIVIYFLRRHNHQANHSHPGR